MSQLQARTLKRSEFRSPGHKDETPTLKALCLVALGVVYGDIGTSPLYAFQVTLQATKDTLAPEQAALGIVSLIVWALLSVVAFKYLAIVLRADNDNEGGILALGSLVNSCTKPGKRLIAGMSISMFLCVMGAAFIFGDGIITPAISVLSAMEGIKVVAPQFGDYIVWATVAILLVLFCAQQFGTHTIGKVFGPVMVAWFIVIGGVGAVQVALHPSVLAALNPWHACELLSAHPGIAFAIFGSIFLALTGGEALYADMGHVRGARAIRWSFFCIVLPALVLNYFGQAAAVIADPSIADNPFYKSFPSFMVVPMVALAGAATIIASQALISGAFSLTWQGIQMGLLPRTRIKQTSSVERGQIYVASVNWSLMVGTIAVSVLFRTSDALAAAYGIAVSGTMLITSILLYSVMRYKWKWNVALALPLTVCFVAIDAGFFVANSLKFIEGGYLPIGVGALLTFVMASHYLGKKLVRDELQARSMDIGEFQKLVRDGTFHRTDRTVVYLSKVDGRIPPIVLKHAKDYGVLPERVFLLTVRPANIPSVQDSDQPYMEVEELGDGLFQVVHHVGFNEKTHVVAAFAAAVDQLLRQGVQLDEAQLAQHVFADEIRHICESGMTVSVDEQGQRVVQLKKQCVDHQVSEIVKNVIYCLAHETVQRQVSGSKMCWGSFQVFSRMQLEAVKASVFFRLPDEKVSEEGIRLHI